MCTHNDTPAYPSPAQPTSPSELAASAWTLDRVRRLGTTTDLATAAQVLGIGRAHAYRLARTGTFPTPVLRAGHRYRIPVAPLLRLLTTGHPDPRNSADPDADHPGSPDSLDHTAPTAHPPARTTVRLDAASESSVHGAHRPGPRSTPQSSAGGDGSERRSGREPR